MKGRTGKGWQPGGHAGEAGVLDEEDAWWSGWKDWVDAGAVHLVATRGRLSGPGWQWTQEMEFDGVECEGPVGHPMGLSGTVG